MTKFHSKYYAYELSRCGGKGVDRLGRALFDACVDLNPHQIEAALFAIDEIKGDGDELPGMGTLSFTNPPTVEFLKANDKLVVDTAFFNEDFKARLTVDGIHRGF